MRCTCVCRGEGGSHGLHAVWLCVQVQYCVHACWSADVQGTLDPTTQQAAPHIAQLNYDRILATMLSLGLPQLRLESQAIKMQHNECMCVWGEGMGMRGSA
jgi:hypothetical protein